MFSIYVATAYYRNINTSIVEEYRKVIPLSLFLGILNLQKQKKTLILDVIGVVFFLFIFILVLISVFYSLDVMEALKISSYASSSNGLFLYTLFVLMAYVLFGIFLFKDKGNYYKNVRHNSFRNSMWRYRNYYLIDYVIDGKLLKHNEIAKVNDIGKDYDINGNNTLSFKNFTNIFIPLLFGVYASLTYNKVYITKVDVINSFELKIEEVRK